MWPSSAPDPSSADVFDRVPGALVLRGAVELGEAGNHLNAVTEIGIAAMVIVALAVGILSATLTFDTVRTARRRRPSAHTGPHG